MWWKPRIKTQGFFLATLLLILQCCISGGRWEGWPACAERFRWAWAPWPVHLEPDHRTGSRRREWEGVRLWVAEMARTQACCPRA